MKLARVEIENFRGIEELNLSLHPDLTVFHGDNAHGKTSVLSAIATGLGSIPNLLPDVTGIGFKKNDLRGLRSLRVGLETVDGVKWARRARGKSRKAVLSELRHMINAIVESDREETNPRDLPIIAYYDTDRAAFDQPQRRKGFNSEFARYAALDGALTARTDFRQFFEWFYARENEELRWQKEQSNSHREFKDLKAIRRAIQLMVPGISCPRIKLGPLRFVVSFEHNSGEIEQLSLDQLSGGYRIMLAVAADLARRMAQGNPHLEDPLRSEAVVLIDEIELHLHPSWQQRILSDLARTFPNCQFIVSTHSPQVLTTVKPENIIELHWGNGSIVAAPVSAPTYGAEAGDVLMAVMGVDRRPSNNEFVETLEKYMAIVANGEGESRKALGLRKTLEQLSPDDPALDRADVEFRRRKVLETLGKSR